jgi:biopolymer transport protein ExbD
MAMSMAGGGASAPQMNVTPLIDVLLVLIIIFMVIVTQTKDKGLEAQIAASSNQCGTPARAQRSDPTGGCGVEICPVSRLTSRA